LEWYGLTGELIADILNITDSRFQEEIAIGKYLRAFKEKVGENKAAIIPGFLGSVFSSPPSQALPYLERMQLDKPETQKEKMMQKIVLFALKNAGEI
jgi:hypothetical protein